MALLHFLQEDARVSVAELGRRVDRSEATVRERLRNLEAQGIIRGYGADIDLAKIGLGVAAHVTGDLDFRRLGDVRRGVTAIPHVVAAQLVTGERPLRMCVVARDMVHLESVLQRRIAPLDIADLRTEVVVEDIVPKRGPDLRAAAAERADVVLRADPSAPYEDGAPVRLVPVAAQYRSGTR